MKKIDKRIKVNPPLTHSEIIDCQEQGHIPTIPSRSLAYETMYSEDKELQILYGKDYFEGEKLSRYGATGGYTNSVFFTMMAKILNVTFQPRKILDVGCAKGFLVQALRERNIEVYGTDISRYAFDEAPENIKPYLQIANISHQPFPDKSFDLVVCMEVLEHLFPNNIFPAIAELYRLTSKYLFITVATLNNIYDRTHFSLFPRESWQWLFEHEGFVLDKKLSDAFIQSKMSLYLDTNIFVFSKK
jgi:SAM-dependent methyltransferase